MGSILYDSTGRRKTALVEIDWSEVTNKPDRIEEIAALGDPGGLRYVGWDDIANELVYFEFDAADIPYDNTTSGLTATNVQDAIDELEALIAATSQTFGGLVGASAGSFSGSAGFSAAYSAPTFTITHNLGTTNYAVQAQQRVTTTPGRAEPSVTARNANSFDIRFYSQTDGININPDWEFILTIFS